MSNSGLYDFREGLGRFVLNGKTGFVDKNGKEAVPPKYDNGYDFSQAKAGVMLNRKWGFINKTGEEIIPFKYDRVNSFDEFRLAKVGINGKFGFVNEKGVEIAALKYNNVESFSKYGLAVVKNERQGLIDTTGNEILSQIYDEITLNEHGIYLFTQGRDIRYVPGKDIIADNKKIAELQKIVDNKGIAANKRLETRTEQYNLELKYNKYAYMGLTELGLAWESTREWMADAVREERNNRKNAPDRISLPKRKSVETDKDRSLIEWNDGTRGAVFYDSFSKKYYQGSDIEQLLGHGGSFEEACAIQYVWVKYGFDARDDEVYHLINDGYTDVRK
jgi:hypothetical protein